MQDGSTLTRIGRVEFLGVVPPGFYMLSVAAFTALAVTDRAGASSPWDRTLPLVELLEHWPIAVLVLLASYLLGQIPRALTVNFTDDLCLLFHRRARKRHDWPGPLFGERFPYRRVLQDIFNDLQDQGGRGSDVSVPDNDERAMVVFDFWKVVLCMRSPHAFSFIQSLEARVRFFVGVFWAGCVGLAGAIVAISVSLSRGGFTDSWFWPAAILGATSALIVFVFGSRLRHVRGEEAIETFLAFLSHRQNNRPPRGEVRKRVPAG